MPVFSFFPQPDGFRRDLTSSDALSRDKVRQQITLLRTRVENLSRWANKASNCEPITRFENVSAASRDRMAALDSQLPTILHCIEEVQQMFEKATEDANVPRAICAAILKVNISEYPKLLERAKGHAKRCCDLQEQVAGSIDEIRRIATELSKSLATMPYVTRDSIQWVRDLRDLVETFSQVGLVITHQETLAGLLAIGVECCRWMENRLEEVFDSRAGNAVELIQVAYTSLSQLLDAICDIELRVRPACIEAACDGEGLDQELHRLSRSDRDRD